jgi:transposase-like protein
MGTKDKERRVYPKEFKAEAVAPAEKHEKPVRQVALDLGVEHAVPVDTAVSGSRGGTGWAPFPGHGRPRDEEPARRRKEVKAAREAV